MNPKAQLRQSLRKSKRILISTHQLPDGDGLGAELALYHYLKNAKKSCRVYNPDPLPKRYQFLDPKTAVLRGPSQAQLWDSWDLWIIVDTNDPRRLGNLWGELSFRSKQIIFLDHHTDTQGMSETEIPYPAHALLVSDPNSSSIGELLYQLFQDLNLTRIQKEIAIGLYVSVMTDTNSFRYARTTPLAHHIAAEMIEKGVNPEEIYQAIYSSKQVSHIQLLGTLLQNVKVAAHGKIAWLEMNLQTRKKFKASADDTQSFMNLLLLIKDAEVICFFREEEDRKVRVSIKSKGRYRVNELASRLGGGGHEYAAGAALPFSLDKSVSTVIKRLEELIAKGL